MSELVRFNEDVKNNESMQSDIKAMGNDLSKIVAYAKEKGYAFEAEDVSKLMNEDKVLSDEDLDTVAGGTVVATGLVDGIGSALFVF